MPEQGEPAAGIGSPDQVRANLEALEAAGVDQVVFVQQAGKNRHEHICESLELFAAQLMPAFKERHESQQQRKSERLAPAVERALQRIPALPESGECAPIGRLPGAGGQGRGCRSAATPRRRRQHRDRDLWPRLTLSCRARRSNQP